MLMVFPMQGNTMTRITGQNIALSLLKSASDASRAQLAISGFLRSADVSVSSSSALNGILAAFQNGDLAHGFATELSAQTSKSDLSTNNAKHNAIVETILKNRDRFPPEGFTITTQLGDGASIGTVIPPAKAKA